MSRTFDITHALVTLAPGARWVHRGFGYEGLEWLDSTNPPTEEEINAEVERLQTEYDNLEYQRQRKAAYPSFADQFDLLYHGGYDAWKASITEIKDQYPKP
jgi:hypothetical protein